GCPTIRAGIVSAARVRIAAVVPAPDYHFAASPHCRVMASASGRVDGGSCPSVVGASFRPIRYSGKRVVSARRCHYPWHLVLHSGPPGLQRLLAPFDRSELHAVFGFLNHCRCVVTPFVLLQGAQYSGFDLRYWRAFRRRHACRYRTIAKHCRQLLYVFVPLAAVHPHTDFSAAVLFVLGAVASDQFDLAVLAAGLFHLPDDVMRSQISLRVPSQLAM